MCASLLGATSFLDILRRRSFILDGEEPPGVLAQPGGDLCEFLAQAVDGLVVHVCLGDEFGERDWDIAYRQRIFEEVLKVPIGIE